MLRATCYLVLAGTSLGACATESPPIQVPQHTDWPHYGGDVGGSRFSPLDRISRDNVHLLEVAWTYRSGEMRHESDDSNEMGGPCGECHQGDAKFEATPIQIDDRLYLSTPVNRVIAIDPDSGRELWRHDPHIDLELDRSEGFVSRGVAYWRDPNGAPTDTCAERILFGTVDARLLALDAATGVPCADFGQQGTVRLDVGIGNLQEGQYGMTSPPVVVHDHVIVGSSIGDNRRVDMERGIVRSYHARTGALEWSWDPIPRSPDDPAFDTWPQEAAAITGGANAWPPLSADPARDLVFIPTGTPAPDFYGGERLGRNDYANSVVALRASTGEVVWHYQVVHHDIWDYDVAAQPTLTTVRHGGRNIDAVAVTTKSGFLYLLDRETGEPLFPVEEVPVPPSTVPGEEAWPSQPIPTRPGPLHPQTLDVSQIFGLTAADSAFCRQQFESLTYQGAFTPPSLEGTLMFPGFAGGVNWGGAAVDHRRQVLVVNVNRFATRVQLHRRSAGYTGGNMRGTPYTMTREMLIAPSGIPCTPLPWGTLAAVDLNAGEIMWEVPLGGAPDDPETQIGMPNYGGPLVTGSGLVFIGATMDDMFRAFDVETGEVLWSTRLPAGGNATPMTYLRDGKQYVVIVAGGHTSLRSTLGDYVVAFALPGR